MGLTPQDLERCTASLVPLLQDAEDAILADMARRLITYNYYIPAAQYQETALQEMGASRQYILRELSKRTGKTQKEIRQLMQEAGMTAVQSDGKLYQSVGLNVPKNASKAMMSILQAGYRQTSGTFTNLCKTTARNASAQLLRELNTTWSAVSSGGMSTDQAVRNAIKRLSEQGVQAISYGNRSDSLEVAVTRAVRTGVNQTAAKVQIQLAEEVGADLVETTAHAGARPTHAEWQGQVFSLSGKDRKYKSLEEGTGYGTGEGLCGWNCRHSFYPWFEGEHSSYTKDELAEYTRPDAVSYNGQSMSRYQAEQTQRYYERQIRRWKRENVAMSAAGLDTYESAAKIKQWQTKQADFLNQTGFKRQSSREQIGRWELVSGN